MDLEIIFFFSFSFEITVRFLSNRESAVFFSLYTNFREENLRGVKYTPKIHKLIFKIEKKMIYFFILSHTQNDEWVILLETWDLNQF